MDHKALLAQLSPEARAALTQTCRRGRDWRSSRFILATIVRHGRRGVALGGQLWWLLIWPQGIAIAFLFGTAHHERHAQEGSPEPFRRVWLSEAMGHLPRI